MNIKKIIQTYDTYMNGAESRVITGGIPYIPGKSVIEKTDYLINNMDEIRKFVLLEPRGKRNLSGAVITEPASPDTDLSVIFMDKEGYGNCYVEDLAGVLTVVAETGMADMSQNVAEIKIGSQFGSFTGRIEFEDESAKSISITPHGDTHIKFKGNNAQTGNKSYVGLKSFITGLHVFLLDAKDSLQLSK